MNKENEILFIPIWRGKCPCGEIINYDYKMPSFKNNTTSCPDCGRKLKIRTVPTMEPKGDD